MENKQSLFDTEDFKQYIGGGGLPGQAVRVFQNEWKKALSNKAHPLSNAVNAFQKGKLEQAGDLIIKSLMEADGNEASPLSLPSLMLYRLPLVNLMREHAEKNFYDKSVLEKMPLEIIRMAAVGIITHEIKGKAGANKGKKQKETVVAAWKAYSTKASFEAFAVEYIDANGGFGESGKPAQEGIPSIRTIAKWIGEYERQRKNTVF